MKLKDLAADWPPTEWTRGPLTWDEDPGLLKLTSVSEPGAAGKFELVAGDAQLCRWSSTLVIDDPAQSAAASTTLIQAIGRSLAEIGELEIET